MVDSPMSESAWQTMMTTFGFAENRPTFEALIAAHDEPHRHYHTADHIVACLKHLVRVKAQLDRPHEVRLSLWFHDAVYKIFSGTNEKDSAAWARKFLTENKAQEDVVARVQTLILITEHHANPKTTDEKFMLDIDLSILGTRPEVYDEFETHVRREYKLVPKLIFRPKRKEILQSFLNMDRIYKTDVFFETHEKQARENLTRTVAIL